MEVPRMRGVLRAARDGVPSLRASAAVASAAVVAWPVPDPRCADCRAGTAIGHRDRAHHMGLGLVAFHVLILPRLSAAQRHLWLMRACLPVWP